MKVFVNNLPKEPKECLFSIKIVKEDKEAKSGFSWHYGCSMNNKACDLTHGHGCNKLKCIF